MNRILALTLLAVAACAAKADSSPVNPEPTDEAKTETPADPEPDEAAAPETKPETKPAEPVAAPTKDLAALVAGNPKATVFADLITVAGLDKDLRSTDISLTILIPTDEAFDKLPKGTVDKWKKNKDALAKILKYHFIPGVNDAQKIGNYRTAPTAAGAELEVKTSQDTEMTIGGARLIDIDIAASNGMIHMIDKVLQQGRK